MQPSRDVTEPCLEGILFMELRVSRGVAGGAGPWLEPPTRLGPRLGRQKPSGRRYAAPAVGPHTAGPSVTMPPQAGTPFSHLSATFQISSTLTSPPST